MKKHGELLLSWEENIFIIHAKGAFNEEGAIAGIAAMKESVLAQNLVVWNRLLFWDDECLSSPSTLKKFKVVHQWFVDKGCKKVAVVVSNHLQFGVAENIFNGHSAKVFFAESDAKKWLALQ